MFARIRSPHAPLFATTAFIVLASTPSAAQEERALFDAPVVVAGTQTRLALTLDYDQDGFEDAVSYWWEDESGDHMMLRVWINDGAGKLVETFSTGVQGQWPGRGVDARVILGHADFDGDALPDFYGIFTHEDRGSLFAWSSGGDDHPDWPTLMGWSSNNEEIHGVVFSDFTQEGQIDRALLLGERLMLHKITTSGTGGSGRVTGSLQFGPDLDHMSAGDWNGDGITDLFINQRDEAHLVTVDSTGAPSLLLTIEHGMLNAIEPVIGDIDGDGDVDVVLFDPLRYTVLRRTGPASFDVEAPVGGGPATHFFDIDLDGDLDGLCCGGGGGGGPDPALNDTPSIFRIALNDGNGAFAPAFEIPGLGADRLAGAADLDHDGDVDLVAGRSVYYPPGLIERSPFEALDSAQSPRTVADFDRDGDPDLECGISSLSRNLGDGTLESFTPIQDLPPAGALYEGPGFPGDFDGDGDDDLVVALVAENDGSFLSMRFLANNGGGGYVDMGDAGAPGEDFNIALVGANTPDASLAADADGDGDLDLIVRAVENPAKSMIWWNAGDRTFGPGPYWSGEIIHDVADFDGDGLPDLLVARERAHIRFGLGAGGFGPRVLDFGLVDPHLDRFACEDIDQDGDVDLGVVFRFPTTTQVTLFWNNGDGSFDWDPLGEIRLANGGEESLLPKLFYAEDVTGDGLRDLVLGPMENGSSSAIIVPRASNGQGWVPENQRFIQVLFPVTETAVEVHFGALVDLDGDGDRDLVGSHIARSRLHAGPSAGARVQSSGGTPSAGGFTPTLGARGPFRVGEAVEVLLTGAPPQTPGLLTARVESTPAPLLGGPRLSGVNGALTNRIAFLTDGTPGAAGSGSWTIPLEVPGFKAGRTYVHDVLLIDPDTGTKSVRPGELRITYGI